MKNKFLLKLDIITCLLCLLPLIIGLAFMNQLPENIPIHFNINNQPDNFASKYFVIFIFPAIFLAFQILCCVLARLDKKARSSPKIVHVIVRLIIPVIGTVVSIISIAFGLGTKLNVGKIIMIILSALIILIGNYLPKCRSNYTIGIKIPTTLSNEENWNKTHRLAGFIYIISGIISLILAILNFPLASLILILVAAISPCIYSIVVSKKV